MDPVSDLLQVIGLGASIAGTIQGASAQRKAALRSSTAQLWQAGQQASAAYTDAEQTGEAAVMRGRQAGSEADLEAGIAHAGADLTREMGNTQMNRVNDATTRTIATQRAFYSGGNLDIQSGSPLAVAAQSAAQGAADAAIVKSNALTRAAGQEWEGYGAVLRGNDALTAAATTVKDAYQTANLRAGGAFGSAAIGAKNAIDAGAAGAATTLLNGVTKWAALGSSGAGQSAIKDIGSGFSSAFSWLQNGMTPSANAFAMGFNPGGN